MKRHVLSLLIVAVAAISLTAQTIRIAPPAHSPVTDADVLVLHEISKTTGQPYGTMPMRYVTEIRQRAGALLDIAIVEPAFSMARMYVTRERALTESQASDFRSDGSELHGGEASFNALRVLRVQPLLGRDFTEADVTAGRRVALLTAGAWQRMFASRADVIGTSIWTGERRLPPQAYEIVGVLPAGLMTATPELDPDLDALVLASTRFETPAPDARSFAPIVRLKPGVTLDVAQRAIDTAVAAAQQAIGTPLDAGYGARLDTMRRPGGR